MLHFGNNISLRNRTIRPKNRRSSCPITADHTMYKLQYAAKSFLSLINVYHLCGTTSYKFIDLVCRITIIIIYFTMFTLINMQCLSPSHTHSH